MDNNNKPQPSSDNTIFHTAKLESSQLNAAKILSLLPLYKLPVALFRVIYAAMDKLVGLNKIAMDKVTDLTIPISTDRGDTNTINLRIFHPSSNIPKKTLVYFHGGGCVIGSINTHDRFCRFLAKHGNMNIISVGYRLAPEHKFPSAICDAIEAWNYINDNHQQLNINPEHIGVGGDSAGAYLACIIGLPSLHTTLPVQIKAKPNFQFLIYPMVDLQGLSESYRCFNKQLLLTRDLMDFFRDHYVNSLDEVTLPLVSPLQAADISQSPSTYLLTLGFDPLRDDGIAYANRLKDAGVNIHHEHYDDCMHGFISITTLSKRAKQACHDIAAALKRFND